MKLKNTYSGLLCTLLCANIAYANPINGQITAGQAQITSEANTTTIQQSSSKAIVNWDSFNISQGETTRFQQPDDGITLNRINSNSGTSLINGVLTANSQIILINGAGIHFGPTAQVNVGGLIASATANISDKNFLNGDYHFNQALDTKGSIINEGSIKTADYGLVALVGNSVTNNGTIEANLGSVSLGSGEQFVISFNPNRTSNDLFYFLVTESGNQSGAEIKNTGKIIADGGAIVVHMNTAEKVLDNVINLDGIVQANNVAEKNGEIFIIEGNSLDPNKITKGSDRKTINVTGKINASSSDKKVAGNVLIMSLNNSVNITGEINLNGLDGGIAAINGNQAFIDGNAKIDVSGNRDGGGIFLVANDKAYVGSNATLTANSNFLGDGGLLYFTSKHTSILGSLSARGGSNGGNGGFISISGASIETAKKYDLGAPKGYAGSVSSQGKPQPISP
ncbi:MAG TPA: filamentous hemagglutinin N-terminal domain-containing protein [Gammaproteobacteria bacterium]|nr:filamentous hemagglutinin N-terminal domain-containing protein [Gammaproteobacteria bacterium]